MLALCVDHTFTTIVHCLKNKLTHKNKVNLFLHTYVVYFQSSEKISWISQHFGWSSCNSTIPDNTPSSVLLALCKIAIFYPKRHPELSLVEETGILVVKLFMFFLNSKLGQETIAKIHTRMNHYNICRKNVSRKVKIEHSALACEEFSPWFWSKVSIL